ncbi:tyrosine phosphatase [Poronia punctata]|nr:tyrosine phosphatase [Poronia punctata]
MATTPNEASFIHIPGVLNFRDIGGYPVSSQQGKEVRRGIVYRSAEPSQITQAGREAIQKLNIAYRYDLRSEQEILRNNGGGWGARDIYAPVFRKEDYSPEAVALRFKTHKARPEGFAEGYSEILVAGAHPDNAARPYARILEHLATTNPKPILIHCQVGKDRTAIICALILSLCGVSDDIVADEYSLSDIGLKSIHEELIAKLLQKEAFREDPESVHEMVLTRRDNMLLLLRKIRADYDSVEQCVVDLGLLSWEGISNLTTNMVVDTSPTEGNVSTSQCARGLWC